MSYDWDPAEQPLIKNQWNDWELQLKKICQILIKDALNYFWEKYVKQEWTAFFYCQEVTSKYIALFPPVEDSKGL